MPEIIQILLAIVIFIIGFGVLVIIHELGHFTMARRFNVICFDFSFGMGPVLVKKKKGETNYCIRAFPIGGQVAMMGEGGISLLLDKDKVHYVTLNDKQEINNIYDSEPANYDKSFYLIDYDIYGKDKEMFITGNKDEVITTYKVSDDCLLYFKKGKKFEDCPLPKYPRNLNDRPKRQRLAIMLAGPIMNLLLALVLFLFIGLFASKPSDSNIIGGVSGNTPIASILKEGDKITKIGNTVVNKFSDISTAIDNLSSYAEVSITYERDSVVHSDQWFPLVVEVNSLGIGNYDGKEIKYPHAAVVGSVYTDIAIGSGIKLGDKIIKIGDKYVNNWYDVVKIMKETDSTTVKMIVVREEGITKVEKELELKNWTNSTLKSQNVPKFSIYMGVEAQSKFDLGYSLVSGLKNFGTSSIIIFSTLGDLFNPSSQIGVNDLSGPIGIFVVIKQLVTSGALNLVYFFALLSVNLGIVNLLPIPALDGGRVLLLGVEAATKKPLNPKVENGLIFVFFVALMALTLYIAIHDIFRW